jgi:hypothetical protein
MGRYAAHRIAELPAPIAQRIDRMFATVFGEAKLTKQELAEAEALTAAPMESRQRSLDLTPLPEVEKVYASHDGGACASGTRGKGTV